MISKKTKYALKAALCLAREYNKGPILISELAKKEAIPRKFLELILLTLKNKGILESKMGKGGGYFLGRGPKTITFGEIIRSIEGPLAPVPCVGETERKKCEECEDEVTCGIRIVMKEVYEATAGILDGISLADVLRRSEDLAQKKNKNYVYHI